jgi:catechol 2,3-dioxygenase-like lactoylglutathione lyase family enzyme
MRIANISLSTNDLDANRRFYAEVLGVPMLAAHERMAVFEGNLVIDAAHGNPTTTGAHVMLVADDLDDVAGRLEGASVPCKRTSWGSLSLSDPDGRMVEVMSTEAWDRAVAANR